MVQLLSMFRAGLALKIYCFDLTFIIHFLIMMMWILSITHTSQPFFITVKNKNAKSQKHLLIIIIISLQFIIYGSYFFLIGAVFLARAVFTMTRTGWRQCWARRYYTEDAQILQECTADTSSMQENSSREVGEASENPACGVWVTMPSPPVNLKHAALVFWSEDKMSV